ncbi:MAG TPA: aminoacyl-tRNA hydrolase [Dissulfurispiraceae bacterium]|nr:aminoacyl-tRNA hydrolase [Dissulfurispiraceae bacterium]
MWIIAGLGNPGSRYEKNRHNVGFIVIDKLSEQYGIALEEKDSYCLGKGSVEGQSVILLKPLTFMNRSGNAVSKVLKKYNALPVSLIVIHDDLDLGTGVIKLKKTGASGGHKGIESIIQGTGTRDFLRVKVGVGRDRDIPADIYVLSNFRPFEKVVIKDAIIKAADAVAAIVTVGIDRAMTRYNRAAQVLEKPGHQE